MKTILAGLLLVAALSLHGWFQARVKDELQWAVQRAAGPESVVTRVELQPHALIVFDSDATAYVDAHGREVAFTVRVIGHPILADRLDLRIAPGDINRLQALGRKGGENASR